MDEQLKGLAGAWYDRVCEERWHPCQHRSEMVDALAWTMDVLHDRPHWALEIGTHSGGTAALWCMAATEGVISLDLPGGYPGSLSREYCTERNAKLSKWPHFHGVLADSHAETGIGSVMDILAVAGRNLDVLFIDGDHCLAGVRQDYEVYAPLVRPGGVVLFHDIVDGEQPREMGCEVPEFWAELKGEKTEFRVGGADWGGIGGVIL